MVVVSGGQGCRMLSRPQAQPGLGSQDFYLIYDTQKHGCHSQTNVTTKDRVELSTHY